MQRIRPLDCALSAQGQFDGSNQAAMWEGLASADGSHPIARSVWLVIGPIETAATPANGNSTPASRAASARCVTLDELVKVAASMFLSSAARSVPGAVCGHHVTVSIHHVDLVHRRPAARRESHRVQPQPAPAERCPRACPANVSTMASATYADGNHRDRQARFSRSSRRSFADCSHFQRSAAASAASPIPRRAPETPARCWRWSESANRRYRACAARDRWRRSPQAAESPALELRPVQRPARADRRSVCLPGAQRA